MCTVTFYPTISDGFILTSSRDEKKQRSTDLPQYYTIENKQLFFPKDKLAGGSWIVSDDQRKTVCLLNGAFEKHERKEKYSRSRGLIVLESFSYSSFDEFIKEVNLQGVEPFTLLLIDNNNDLQFTELRWDESKKHVSKVDISKPHIWSSATLYDQPTRLKREAWFKELLTSQQQLSKKELFNFHLSKHDHGSANDIVMERANGLQTVSVSQVINNKKRKEFTYYDLILDQRKEQILNA